MIGLEDRQTMVRHIDTAHGGGHSSQIRSLRPSPPPVSACCCDTTGWPANEFCRGDEGVFTEVLNRVHEPMCYTLPYTQCREISQHKYVTKRTGDKVYFADLHSPWQHGSNENTNSLLRLILHKGSDLSGFSQDNLDAIALRTPPGSE